MATADSALADVSGAAAVPGLPVTGYQHSVVPYAAMAMFKDEREFALQPAADVAEDVTQQRRQHDQRTTGIELRR